MVKGLSFLTRLRKKVASEKLTVKIAWIGLDGAGKTTLLKLITHGEFISNPMRTLGMNVDEFSLDGIKFISWDIGGQVAFRESLWEAYLKGSMGIIFVIDSTDQDRFPEAQEEFVKYVSTNSSAEQIPILILANKQDIENAVSTGEVARALGLHKITNRSYAIFPTSAKKNENVDEGLEWLRKRITEKIDLIKSSYPSTKITGSNSSRAKSI